MNKIHTLATIFLVLSALFFGCGDRFSRVDTIRGYTTVSLTTNYENILKSEKYPDPQESIGAAGTMIFYKNNNTGAIHKTFVSYTGASSTISLTLPNSEYTFYALSYNDFTSAGTPYCSGLNTYNLNGNALNINLMPSNAICNLNYKFTSNAVLQNLKVNICASTDEPASWSPSSNCTNVPYSTSTPSINIKIVDDNGDGFIATPTAINTTLPNNGLNTNPFPIVPEKYIPIQFVITASGGVSQTIKFNKGLLSVDGTTPGTVYNYTLNQDEYTHGKFVTGDATYPSKLFYKF